MTYRLKSLLMPLVLCGSTIIAQGQSPKAAASTARPAGPKVQAAKRDLSKQPTLYVVPYAHLDTQWNWDYPTTINEFLPATMRGNFALFQKYPHYVFNFSGANRYRMMKEYYPQDYAQVEKYVAAGRWFPAGSAMEENDVNNPSAESVMRQILYGSHYFRSEFGKTSAEYMLPDCFGFPSSLPSILAHMGLKGFSTQKLAWHSGSRVGGPGSPQETPVGIPFNVGFWKGPDGKGVIAALNATRYAGDVTEDLTTSDVWNKRVDTNGKSMGLFTDYRYYGVGDQGGSPREQSVALMESLLTRKKALLPNSSTPVPVGAGPLHVVQTTAEQMFLDIPPSAVARMPQYQGDLELVEHSAGSLTSQAYMKKWNRENEVLADQAERASVAAAWMGGARYAQQRLNHAWTLVLGGQFHDIIPGTSIPRAYEYSWNDEVLAMNQFASVLTSATESIASGLNTQVKGTPIVVYNSLNIRREDVVEATVVFPNGTPQAVRVFGPDGREVPAQLDNNNKVVFLATVPSVGYAVYDVQAADTAAGTASTLKLTDSSLENARYRVTLDKNGDVGSIFDKKINKELLAEPLRLAFKEDKPRDWPAWNMDWADQQKPPRAYVGGPITVRVVENGPARVALQVTREAEGSKVVQVIRLAAGDAGNRVEFSSAIDWRTAESNLKAMFPLTASNPVASYNLDLGAIQRGNDDENKFEVVSHQWFDLTDKGGTFGVTILSGAKNGSNKPNDSTLGLTLLRSPGIVDATRYRYPTQTTQDWGHHEFVYGLAAHAGDWRQEKTAWQAWRLDTPLVAFESTKHPGALGNSFSLLKISNPGIRVLALKKAEDSDEIVLRMAELEGSTQQNVHVAFAGPIVAAREVNGQELPLGSADVVKGELVTNFTSYQPRTFALKLTPSSVKLGLRKSLPVSLAYDHSVATPDGRPSFGAFDATGRALAAEMLPRELSFGEVEFKLAPATEGQPNAIDAKGQKITLPAGDFNTVYLLAASDEGDQKVAFSTGGNSVEVTIPYWTGFIGQWDDREWKTEEEPLPPEPAANDTSAGAKRARLIRQRAAEKRPLTRQEYVGLTPGFIKGTPVAWFASHLHGSSGANEAYQYSYLFPIAIPLAANSRTLTLPKNEHIRILAITVTSDRGKIEVAQPLYDTLQHQTSTEAGTAR